MRHIMVHFNTLLKKSITMAIISLAIISSSIFSMYNICPICCEPLKEKTSTLECTHRYHMACIIKYIIEHAKPTCHCCQTSIKKSSLKKFFKQYIDETFTKKKTALLEEIKASMYTNISPLQTIKKLEIKKQTLITHIKNKLATDVPIRKEKRETIINDEINNAISDFMADIKNLKASLETIAKDERDRLSYLYNDFFNNDDDIEDNELLKSTYFFIKFNGNKKKISCFTSLFC